MKITIVSPPPSPEYSDVVWSAKDAPSLPQTGPAVLSAYVKKNAPLPIDVICIPTQVVIDGCYRYYTTSEIVDLCEGSDIVGLTCLFHNQQSAIDIACAIKQKSPSTKTVLGGQNVSCKHIARLILKTVPQVDLIVLGEGEKALLEIVKGTNPENIPNLCYRDHDGSILFTQRQSFNLDSIPIWDYENCIGIKDLLQAHDSRTELYRQHTRQYKGRTCSELAVFSKRGCPKAAGLISTFKGPCRFCASSRCQYTTMNIDNFWHQLKLLNESYGLQDFFIADNVFGENLEELRMHIAARDRVGVMKSVRFRAYTYPTVIASRQGKEVARLLKFLGVSNVFLGVETFDPRISIKSNKDPISLEQTQFAIDRLTYFGIDVYIPIMPGLPGETKRSLALNLKHLQLLLQEHASDSYEGGKLTRVDISPAMPLVGTPWFHSLMADKAVCKEYLRQTGRSLKTEICPDLGLLRGLSLAKYKSDLTENDIQEFDAHAKQLCLKHLTPEMVGGFDLRLRDVT